MDFEQGQSTKQPIDRANELKVGDILDDRYQLTEIIGRGGCGLVFKATDNNLQRDVAVKVLSGEGLVDSEVQKKFDNESQILRRLHAQNTVFFYDCGQTVHHQPYIVMEFVSGKQLKDLLEEEEKLSPKRTVAILTQVFSALEEAHKYGFIHRDLKPGNIMLCQRPGFPDDFVKVLDFGIAKIMTEEDKVDIKKDMSEMAGTPKYMPPEQFKNETLTPLADLYSMGCIAYEMLTGIAPFDGDTLHVIVAKHLIMTPKSFPPEIEQYPNLVATIFKLLEKQPEARFASARKVIEALEHWAEPELIPTLQGCRIKGDDNQENSFFDEDVSETSAIKAPSPDFLSYATQLSVSSPTPISIEPHHPSTSQAAAIPLKKHSKKQFPVKMVTIISAATIVLMGIVLLIMDPLKLFSDSEDDLLPPPTVAVHANHISETTIELVSTTSFDALQDAIAFGLQDKEALEHLDDFFYGMDEFNDEDESVQDDESSHKAKPSSGEGVEATKRKHSKSSESADLKFSFTLRYTPSNARVGFLNANGTCSKKGICKVQTTSTTTPARIVVSAPGYISESRVVEHKVSDIKIELKPESDK